MKRDGYAFDEHWENWKTNNFKSIKGISKENHKLLIDYLKDMELGINVPADRKGKRTSGTLLNLATHNLFFLKQFKISVLKLKKEDIAKLEVAIDSGKIKKRDGKKFTAFGNYIKDFKAFWNWMMRTGKVKENILIYTSSKTEKPEWVYLTEEQIKTFFNSLIADYRAIAWFMYDSGARVTEANSIQIKHFSKDFKQVTIPDEAAKTFGRTINLKHCSELVKSYVAAHNLKEEDFLFQKDLFTMNKYFKENCGKKFGKDVVSNPKSKGKYGNFTLYDIRHNSACYWLGKYPTHSKLMYRMGWKQADKIDYYTGFLGQADTLTDEDMVAAEDKPKIYQLEKEMEKMKKMLADISNGQLVPLTVKGKTDYYTVKSKKDLD